MALLNYLRILRHQKRNGPNCIVMVPPFKSHAEQLNFVNEMSFWNIPLPESMPFIENGQLIQEGSPSSSHESAKVEKFENGSEVLNIKTEEKKSPLKQGKPKKVKASSKKISSRKPKDEADAKALDSRPQSSS